jgi:hypothetical protein
MKEAIGIVEKGAVKLPETVHLPDGLEVRVVWDDSATAVPGPAMEREPLSREDVEKDVAWATGNRFKR